MYFIRNKILNDQVYCHMHMYGAMEIRACSSTTDTKTQQIIHKLHISERKAVQKTILIQKHNSNIKKFTRVQKVEWVRRCWGRIRLVCELALNVQNHYNYFAIFAPQDIPKTIWSTFCYVVWNHVKCKTENRGASKMLMYRFKFPLTTPFLDISFNYLG